MFDHLDHVGIAVDDMDAAVARYRDDLGMRVTHDERVEAQGTHVIFLATDSGPELELLAPLDPESPVGRFLAKRGPGMHHLCYAVHDLPAAVARAGALGLEVIDPRPRLGARGKWLVFLHPKSVGGVMIELYQPGWLPAAVD